MTHALLSEPIFLKRVYVPSRFICFTASDGPLNYSIKPTSKAHAFRVLTVLIKKSFIILIFLLLSLLVSIIKTYCGHKARFEHNINYLSLLKLHKRNLSFRKLFDALLNKGSSTVYQILKELLDDIALNARRSKPSNRDRVLLKDLPLLIWQIVNHPRLDRKVA